MKRSKLLFMLMTVCSLRAADLPVVPSLDLKRYAGNWYEVARLPNRFQRDCAGDITATYTLRSDGDISVVNACRDAKGKVKRSEGKGKLADRKGPTSKLKVTFFWPFYGDYWVINLDPDYRWAVVGEPDRDYLWILSRTEQIDEGLYQKLLSDAKQKGFDTSRVIRTPQLGKKAAPGT